jgi:hypothetical protein
MNRIFLRQRWLPLPWGVYGLALVLVFGGIGVYSWFQPEEDPSVRVAVPFFGVMVYLVLAALCNRHDSWITPERVRERIWPLPLRPPRSTGRDQVRFCYVRQVRVIDEGTELENHFYAGVQTRSGRQLETSGPHNTREEAARVAASMAAVLNQAPGQERVAVVEVEQMRTRAEAIGLVLTAVFWVGVSVAAIAAGVAWELRYRNGRRDGESRRR